jgi:hypothetical protein
MTERGTLAATAVSPTIKCAVASVPFGSGKDAASKVTCSEDVNGKIVKSESEPAPYASLVPGTEADLKTLLKKDETGGWQMPKGTGPVGPVVAIGGGKSRRGRLSGGSTRMIGGRRTRRSTKGTKSKTHPGRKNYTTKKTSKYFDRKGKRSTHARGSKVSRRPYSRKSRKSRKSKKSRKSRK